MTFNQSDRASLKLTILERPYDDAPRLVYADFLDDIGEHGLADFIRRHIAGEVLTPDFVRSVLLGIEMSGWCVYTGKTRQIEGFSNRGILVYRRGMIEQVATTCAEFMNMANVSWFSDQPIIDVLLTDKKPDMLAGSSQSGSNSNAVWCELAPGIIKGPLPSQIPYQMFHLMPCSEFPTAGAAVDALSKACVAYGRSVAGLPPLTEVRT